MTLKNRFVLPPMVTQKGGLDGSVTDEILEHYEAIAKGQVGLIIVEATAISWEHRIMKKNICIHNDEAIPGLTELASRIKAHGAKAFIQLVHAGPKNFSGGELVGPSPVRIKDGSLPRELSVTEIHEIKAQFVAAAKRAKAAGFDGVEVHAAHFYLLSAFMSPYANQRTDDYGGSVENRLRFAVEVVKAIREELGDYPIIYRMNCLENVIGGIDIEEAVQAARIIEEAGVDMLHISGIVDHLYRPEELSIFSPESPPDIMNGYPYDCWAPAAAKIREHVNVPVIGVGMVRDATLAERIMDEDLCDLLAVGRGILADPNFAEKVLSGKGDTILPWDDSMET
ncbi:MAG: NADH:flavin oxidoreductase [Candidatus Thorarchaeota archaeon]|nr:MAG: NADH:flavin oxidoreductase [Candidatus Thorarchaeota archaeon]